jgi:phosphatidylserine/phosphatidylglycerophosphate/cardiolipin synthase-like enzyme
VQVLRTYPARRTGYPFARSGERSIARAYLKAFGRARRLIYLEDQYLWSLEAARALAAALEREPDLRLVVVVPRFPDPAGRVVGNASRYGRERVLTRLSAAGGDRVAVYDLENEAGTPIYVHAKVCIVDDTWMTVGSDNLNRRSWTHDSEITCAVIDETLDEREPRDLSGRGDGARVLARETRLSLAREHLAAADCGPADLVDPVEYFDALRDSARALDGWHAGGRRGPRPPGHLRLHPTERVGWPSRAVLHLAHAWILDPDGRPRRLRRHDAY